MAIFSLDSKHKDRMQALIESVCFKHGVDVDTFKRIRFYGATSIHQVAEIHKELERVSPGFLNIPMQSEILGIPLGTISSRLNAVK